MSFIGSQLLSVDAAIIRQFPERNFRPSELQFDQIIEDPSLDSEPATIINGSSGEFSGAYHTSSAPGDYNYLNLTFDHIANTSLEFRPTVDDDYPDSYDFIYCYQDIEWDAEEYPVGVRVSFEVRAFFTGDFNSSFGDDMVVLYAWLISPTGNWYRLMRSPFHYIYAGGDFTERKDIVDYISILNAFPEPEDVNKILKIAVGWSPVLNFYGTGEGGPWSYFNGSATLQIRSMRVDTVSGDYEQPDETYPYVGLGYWGGEFDPWFPDMTLGLDDSVYTIGHFSDYTTHTVRHNLAKHDALGNVQWVVSLDSVRGDSVTVSGDYVYTAGRNFQEHNIALMKWTSGGVLVWNKTIDAGGDDSCSRIASCSDGSLILVGDSLYGNETIGFTSDSFMMKTNAEGEKIWLNAFENAGLQYYELYIDDDDRIFTLNVNQTGIAEWNTDGDRVSLVYTDYSHRFTISGDYIYSLFGVAQDGYFNITKMTKTGDIIWVNSVNGRYNDLWTEYITADSLAVNKEGEVYILAKHHRFQYRWVLYKFDTDGFTAWNQTVLEINWLNLYNGMYGDTQSAFGKNGLLYIGGVYAPTEDAPFKMAVAVFNPDDAPLPFIFHPLLLPLAGGISIIVIGVILYRVKKK